MNDRLLILVVSPNKSIPSAVRQTVDASVRKINGDYEIKEHWYQSPAELFRWLSDTPHDRLREAIIVLDATSQPPDLWAIRDLAAGSSLPSQLALSFPEMYLVLLTGPDAVRAPSTSFAMLDFHEVPFQNLESLASVIARHSQGFRTWFDPTRLRCALKMRIFDEVLAGSDLPPAAGAVRRHLARRRGTECVAIDEEGSFIQMSGYAMYRAGGATWLAESHAQLKAVLGDLLHSNQGGARFALAVTDWDLRYADYDGHRDNPLLTLDALAPTKVGRVLVLSGHVEQAKLGLKPKAAEWQVENRFEFLSKPFGSLQVLGRGVPADDLSDSAPPSAAPHANRHTAPYSCRSVADRLLARARRVRGSSPCDPTDWIHIALLALEAKETLWGLSRTSALAAIALQQEAEVSAEVSFHGATADLEVVQRMDELESEVAGYFPAGTEDRFLRESWLSFLLRTINSLRGIVAEADHVAAAEQCLERFSAHERELREWYDPNGLRDNRPLDARRARRRSIRRWLVAVGTAYLDSATKSGTSIRRLIVYSMLVVIVFALIYNAMWLGYRPPAPEAMPASASAATPEGNGASAGPTSAALRSGPPMGATVVRLT